MINEVTSYNFLPAEKNPYVDQVRTLLAQGARVKGIGLQYHYFRRAALDSHLAGANCDPGKMLDLYEKLADFQLPLFITEITIPSAGPDGEALQAEVVRDHYRLWFSAPSMAGITWWNLGDGTAVKGENEAQGGLADGALKPKAAYRALDQLINQQWKTRAEIQTDASGIARFRGFFGRYQVKAEGDGKTRQAEIEHTRSGSKTYRLTW
jgi:GH35 family endo-1,4-beta-xylanase